MTLAKFEAGARDVPWTLALCFLAALTEGFDIQSMGVAAPGLASALALSHDQLGPAFSASLLGLLIGSLILGRMADRMGRKWTLIASMLIFGVFSAATVLAWDAGSLITIRGLAGLGLGGALPNLVALAAEAAAPSRRARMVTLIASGLPFGSAVSAAVALLGWKAVFLVGGAAPLMLAPLMARALPESRRFLQAREDRGGTKASQESIPRILFGGSRLATTVLLWSGLFAALLTLHLMLNWLPTLMISKGVSKDAASFVSLLFNLGGGAGVLVVSALLARGRRAWTLGGLYAGMALSLIALASVNADLAATAIAGFAAGTFISVGPIALYGLAPDYYAVAMRGTGVGTAMAAGRLGAVLGPLLAAPLLNIGAGSSGVLLALTPLVAVGGGATLLLLRRPTVAD